MAKYRTITPEGTKDVLFEECAARRKVENNLSRMFEGYGFTEAVTPGVEYLDVFDALPQEQMYKWADSKGRMITLRPDSTMPIARLTATRLKNHCMPLRLYYNQSVYHASRSLSGHSNEVVQMGIEILGANADRSDLEALSMALEVLESSAAADFRLEINYIGIIYAVLQKLSLDSDTTEEIRMLIESKNYPALGDYVEQLGNHPMRDALLQIPRLFGGAEVLDRASKLFGDPEIDKMISYLRDLYTALTKLTDPSHITVDLGLVNRPAYYTGIVFRGYLTGHGEEVLSGGRYDKLLSYFGMDLPAVGFAVHPDALAAAMLDNGEVSLPHAEVLVYAEDGCEVEALIHRRKLADEQLCVEYAAASDEEAAMQYAVEKKISRVDIVSKQGITTKQVGGERL